MCGESLSGRRACREVAGRPWSRVSGSSTSAASRREYSLSLVVDDRTILLARATREVTAGNRRRCSRSGRAAARPGRHDVDRLRTRPAVSLVRPLIF